MIRTVLFIIFGWPLKEKVAGAVFAGKCPHCRNDTIYYNIKQRRWISFFFIPLLPLGRAKYQVICEVCGVGWDIPRSDVSEYKTLTSLLESYQLKELTADEYLRELESVQTEIQDPEFLEPMRDILSGEYAARLESYQDQPDACPECETPTKPTDSYCTKCGADLRPDVTLDCPECGETQPADDEYCSECGGELEPAAEWESQFTS